MTAQRRIMRVNSLLKEVISDVIRHDLKHHKLPELITITDVNTSKDLMYAKVFVSLINGNEIDKKLLIAELQKCSSSIARLSSKKVVLRYFPVLTFEIDNTMDDYMKIDDLLREVNKNKKFKKDEEDEDFHEDDESFEELEDDEDFEDDEEYDEEDDQEYDEEDDEDYDDEDDEEYDEEDDEEYDEEDDEDYDDEDDEEYDEDDDEDYDDEDEDDEEYDEDDDEFEYEDDEK